MRVDSRIGFFIYTRSCRTGIIGRKLFRNFSEPKNSPHSSIIILYKPTAYKKFDYFRKESTTKI